ncbi:MAG TPA: hypothetical protein VFY14_22805 [Streptomyces sp.]|nr:hypothetical protein [Streptomyces sp.]
MNTTHIRRTITTAATVSIHLKYAALSGQVLANLIAGRVIRVSTHLQRLGFDEEFIRRYGSPFGRHTAKHYRTRTGREPLRCWIRNDAGRYIHVFVYDPADFALAAAVSSYKRTRDAYATAA